MKILQKKKVNKTIILLPQILRPVGEDGRMKCFFFFYSRTNKLRIRNEVCQCAGMNDEQLNTLLLLNLRLEVITK